MLLLFLSLLAAPGLLEGATIPPHFKEEGHKILKRFVDHQEYDGHDIAHVLHKRHPDTFHHISRRDLTSVVNPEHHSDFSTLRLDMASSQDSLTLNLKKRSIVDDSTEFVSLTNQGRVRRSPSVTGDCFATGHAEGSPNEVAAVSMCNGLHGVASSNGFDYYIHPVESDISDEEHQVHVLWRRSADDESVNSDNELNDTYVQSRSGRQFDAWKTETDLVFEFALFTDAKAWRMLQEIAPGRENEYMLVAMAATNALYGDKDKVGYNVLFKIKLIEFWEKDPKEYKFKQDLASNLDSFCQYTREKYANPKYDMHFLHTGITEQNGPAAGMAYMTGVCSIRCGNSKSLSPNRHRLIAHEVGHNLGFNHHEAAECPDEIKQISGGFMGGGGGGLGGLDFSPCNKWELHRLFSSGKGSCLFEEVVGMGQPRVFPGQSRSPDKLCELYVGFGYKYFRPHELTSDAVCQVFMCINSDPNSPAYQSIIEINTPIGFPCGEEMSCFPECQPWAGTSLIGWDVDHVRTFKQNPEWSEWPKRWSDCSSTCGIGVQVKERECLIEEGPFVSPYCNGSDKVQARLCSKTPCKDEPDTAEKLRKALGDEICKGFLKNKVQLSAESTKYRPVYNELNNKKLFSKSCFVGCKRKNDDKEIDGMFPNGTPCPDATRSSYDLQRFGIEMRCAIGKCLEFSDCKDNEPMDTCGVCTNKNNYDESRCVTKTISDANTDYLAEGEGVVIATIPAGSTGINVEGLNMKNGRFEMWAGDELELVWGQGGQFSKGKYQDDEMLDYAGTKWSLSFREYVRADGPTNKDIVLNWVVGSSSTKQVDVNYLMP